MTVQSCAGDGITPLNIIPDINVGAPCPVSGDAAAQSRELADPGLRKPGDSRGFAMGSVERGRQFLFGDPEHPAELSDRRPDFLEPWQALIPSGRQHAAHPVELGAAEQRKGLGRRRNYGRLPDRATVALPPTRPAVSRAPPFPPTISLTFHIAFCRLALQILTTGASTNSRPSLRTTSS